MSMFNDISCEKKGNEEECLRNAESVKSFARRFGIGQWSFIGPGSEKKWYSSENSPQGAWDNSAEKMLLEICGKWTSFFPCNNSIVQGCSQKQGERKIVYTFRRRSRYN